MKIVKLKINDIHPYGANAKLHPERQIAQIKESIKSFGNNDPIAVDENHVIIEGHGRYIALKQMGYEEVDCIILTGMTEEQKNAYRLVHNKLTMNSDFDLDLLTQELENISFDMEQFDFELPDIDEGDIEVTEDEIPMVDEEHEPKTKPGNLYKLGNHYLLCGDSTKKEDVEKLMKGGSNKLTKADMVFTDPPYGMGLDTDFSSMKNHLDFAKEKGFVGGKKYEQGIVDDFKPELITTIFNNFDYCKEIFIWGADYFAEMLPNRNDGSWIVWDKRANGNDDIEQDYSSDKMYGSCFELCWSKNKHKRDIARVKWASVFGTEQEFDKKRYHPTQKPIKLTSWFIKRYSKEKDIIADLFGGSGSTLIACEQLNRKCRMMELDPKYCDVIITRWENFTGRKAELIEGEINE